MERERKQRGWDGSHVESMSIEHLNGPDNTGLHFLGGALVPFFFFFFLKSIYEQSGILPAEKTKNNDVKVT